MVALCKGYAAQAKAWSPYENSGSPPPESKIHVLNFCFCQDNGRTSAIKADIIAKTLIIHNSPVKSDHEFVQSKYHAHVENLV